MCFLGTLDATVTESRRGAAKSELSFSMHSAYLDQAIEALGDPPLPPYIAGKRDCGPRMPSAIRRSMRASEGAVAAPTAGLHFTDRLFAALDAQGVTRHFVTLHVGAGTFLPVKAGDTAEHRMHAEWGEISAADRGRPQSACAARVGA